MRWMWLAVVAGCNFQPSDGAPPPGPGSDTPEVDAPVAVARCTVHSTGTVTEQGSVGGPGGGGRPDLACSTGEFPIGAEFETTVNPLDQGGFNSQQIVVTTHIRCGRIERTTANEMVTTPTARISRPGTGCGNAVASSGEKLCPPGAVFVGIRGNESGGQFSSVNSVQLVCAALATDGSATGPTTTLDFRPSTGNYTNDPEASMCPADTAVTAFGGAAGCTQDQIWAKCAPLTCD